MKKIEKGTPAEVPMKQNELPQRPAVYVSRPYIIDIKSLAKGDYHEYDIVGQDAKECVDFFNEPGNDHRVLGVHMFRLVNFEFVKNSSLPSVSDWILQNGFYLPPMLYVNDFAKANLEIQRTISIFSLGEPEKPFVSSRGFRGILALNCDEDDRTLNLEAWDSGSNSNYWYLVCDKSFDLLIA